MTIDDLKVGQSGTIAQVGGEGALPIQIQVRGYELTIRREDAARITLKEEQV